MIYNMPERNAEGDDGGSDSVRMNQRSPVFVVASSRVTRDRDVSRGSWGRKIVPEVEL